MNILEVNHISKHYKNFDLKDICFSLPAGYIMGYIGQNGAGKSTSLNIITHLIHSDSGAVLVNGIDFEADPIRYRDAIGYIGDSSYFPEEINVLQVQQILADFYPSFSLEKFQSYVKNWELPTKKNIKTFSRGMKVKLMFASVLSRNTHLLVLDEATNGLDPVMRKEVLNLLQEYIADGTRSVLFSTHILEDLEQIADYIFFIDQGQKIYCDTKEELLERFLLVKGGPQDLTPALSKELVGIETNSFGFEALLPTESTLVPGSSLMAVRPSIDQIVLHTILGKKVLS